MNTEFKDRINRIKLQYGMNQEQIAKELDVTRSYLSAVIGGSSPYSNLLRKKVDERFPDDGSGVPKEEMVTIPASTLEMMTETINRLTEVNLSQQKDISRLIGMIAPQTKQNAG